MIDGKNVIHIAARGSKFGHWGYHILRVTGRPRRHLEIKSCTSLQRHRKHVSRGRRRSILMYPLVLNFATLQSLSFSLLGFCEPCNAATRNFRREKKSSFSLCFFWEIIKNRVFFCSGNWKFCEKKRACLLKICTIFTERSWVGALLFQCGDSQQLWA